MAERIDRRQAIKKIGIGTVSATLFALGLSRSSAAAAEEEEQPTKKDVMLVQAGTCRIFDRALNQWVTVTGPCEGQPSGGYTPEVGVFVGPDLKRMWGEAVGPDSHWPVKDQKIIADLTHGGYTGEQVKEANEFFNSRGYSVTFYPEGVDHRIVDAALQGYPQAQEAVNQALNNQ